MAGLRACVSLRCEGVLGEVFWGGYGGGGGGGEMGMIWGRGIGVIWGVEGVSAPGPGGRPREPPLQVVVRRGRGRPREPPLQVMVTVGVGICLQDVYGGMDADVPGVGREGVVGYGRMWGAVCVSSRGLACARMRRQKGEGLEWGVGGRGDRGGRWMAGVWVGVVVLKGGRFFAALRMTERGARNGRWFTITLLSP